MRFQQLILIGAMVVALPSATLWAQTRTMNASASRPVHHASYGSGCASCGVPPVVTGSAPSCGCEGSYAGPCGRGCCSPCCRPNIIPTIVRGVDRVVDHVGDALCCIFTRPCYGPAACCPAAACPVATPCCVRPCAPRVYRPCYRTCDGCSDGCSGCGNGMGPSGPPSANPFADEPEGAPMAPKDARNYQLWNMKPPMYGKTVRPALEPIPAQTRPANYGNAPAANYRSASTNIDSSTRSVKSVKAGTPTLATPRQLNVDNSNASKLSDSRFEIKDPIQTVRQTSSSMETSSRTPRNPLRN